MAVAQTNVRTNGSKYQQRGTMRERTVRLTGDGVGATVNIANSGMRRPRSITSPYPFVIDNANQRVQIVVPASLPNGSVVEVRIAGN